MPASDWIATIARMIGRHVHRRNPILLWGITAILPTVNGGRQVEVQRGNFRRRAIYLPPNPPVVNGGVFVTGMGNATNMLMVIATNYQVPWTPIFYESPLLLVEIDPGPDGVLGTWDDIHYLMRDDDGYYLVEG